MSGVNNDILPTGITVNYSTTSSYYKVGSESINVNESPLSTDTAFMVPHFSALNGNTFTITCWVYATVPGYRTYIGIFDHNGYVGVNGTQNGWGIFYKNGSPNGKIAYVTAVANRPTGRYKENETSSNISHDTWHFLALRVNGTAVSIQVDGTREDFTHPYDLSGIHQNQGSAEGIDFDKYIDSFRYYDNVLTNDEITAIYDSEV